MFAHWTNKSRDSSRVLWLQCDIKPFRRILLATSLLFVQLISCSCILRFSGIFSHPLYVYISPGHNLVVPLWICVVVLAFRSISVCLPLSFSVSAYQKSTSRERTFAPMHKWCFQTEPRLLSARLKHLIDDAKCI